MSKIYKFKGGGQQARQNVNLNLPFVYSVDENSDWPERSGSEGAFGYTGMIWGTDFDTFKRHIEEWAGQEIELTEEEEKEEGQLWYD